MGLTLQTRVKPAETRGRKAEELNEDLLAALVEIFSLPSDYLREVTVEGNEYEVMFAPPREDDEGNTVRHAVFASENRAKTMGKRYADEVKKAVGVESLPCRAEEIPGEEFEDGESRWTFHLYMPIAQQDSDKRVVKNEDDDPEDDSEE